MSKNHLNDAELLALEKMIDKAGVSTVIMRIGDICGEKAEHILHNWQDAKLAKVWNDAAQFLEVVRQQEKLTRIP